MKVKLITGRNDFPEDEVNEFIEDKDVLSIEFDTSIHNYTDCSYEIYYNVLVVYKEGSFYGFWTGGCE